MSKIVISCVLDSHPKFLMQCWNWLASLDSAGTPARADIVIHHTPSVADGDVAFFRSLGARMERIEPFGEGVEAYCNKIRQLQSAAFQGADYAILCDLDLLFAGCPTQFAVGDAIRAKIVDFPNPPLALCQALVERAGLDPDAPTAPTDFAAGFTTLATNFNGGLYVLPATVIPALRTAWPKWARFCLDQKDLLGPWQHHADQLGLALSILEARLPVAPLGRGANFPTHLETANYLPLKPESIIAFHYHNRMDIHGFAGPLGIPWVDAELAAANDAIRPYRRRTFNNAIFWNFRYAQFPDLGSGIGSRGSVLAYKRRLITPYIKAFVNSQILDVGCGDLETTRHATARHYAGIDRSKEAIAIAQGKRPDWRFGTVEVGEFPDRAAALVLCLDLLIHEAQPERFQSMIDELLRVTGNALLVSGYEAAPDAQGIIYFHEPLSQAFKRRRDVESITEIGRYRDVVLFLITKRPAATRHHNDIDLPALAWGFSETPDSEILTDLVALSRDKLGFFPKTVIRALEYPWFAKRMADAAGKRILDVGAGVNVLPFWLAARGAEVVTVDNHPLRRDLADRSNWNEWGFLDYGAMDGRIASFNMDMAKFALGTSFDVIYSVSVIEHMPAATRRAVIGQMAALLAPGARLLLSLDLVPGSDALWPLSEGVRVDVEGAHGSIQDVLAELRGAGLAPLEWGVRREIPGSRTDLLFLIAAAAEAKLPA